MKRIMIVDDIEENLYLLRVLLEGHGYKVEQAKNGSDAYEKALQSPPDMVISDILMPIIDGFTLCRMWKSDDQLKNSPFIFYTATYTDSRDEKLALDMGADAFIFKPAEPDEFLSRIEKILVSVKETMPFPQHEPKAEENLILKEYNEALIRKLEQKLIELERVNRKLEDEIKAKEKIEKDLRESEERFRELHESMMDAFAQVDMNGIIVSFNTTFIDMLGYTAEEIVQLTYADITPEKWHAFESDIINNQILKYGYSEIYEKEYRRKDGTTIPVELRTSLLADSTGKPTGMWAIVRDITHRKQVFEALQTSLNEKKDLISEIYHRTKNNMQVIISMLSLQSISTDDEKLVKILKDMENRIRAMALVHDKLYQSKSLSRINLKYYLIELVDNIMSSYDINVNKILTIFKIDDLEVLIDTAIPCGLVVNELVSNVARHAFPYDEKGELRISLSADKNGEIKLIVADNGTGIGRKLDINNNETMGLQIIKHIVEYQLKGSIEFNNLSGIEWIIKFKDSFYKERI